MKIFLRFKSLFFLGIILTTIFSCNNTTKEKYIDLSGTIDSSLHLAKSQYTWMNQFLPDSLFPCSLNPDSSMMTNTASGWTSGFFPGSLWYLYEYSGDKKIKQIAAQKTRMLALEQWNNNDPDIGLKINCSYGDGYRITGDSSYKHIILNAARTLSARFNPRVGCLRSWGKHNDSSHYLVTIKTMMNLELLFNASRLSGDSSFFWMAVSHADVTMKNHFRPDGSSFQVVDYNPRTGKVQQRRTAWGYSDASSWARGQAWGLYGYTMCYHYTRYKRYLRQAEKIAAFILDNPNLPKDYIPYWDFDAPNIPIALRDASAAAIMASAFEELSEFVNGKRKANYQYAAARMIQSLSSPLYRSGFGDNGNFLIKHCVGNFPANSEIDVPLSYADYYYLEAMMRWRKNNGKKEMKKQ